jgi:hypothetical protein
LSKARRVLNGRAFAFSTPDLKDTANIFRHVDPARLGSSSDERDSMTPQLLNDDGSASMATALMMSHHAFRRDLARFAAALRRTFEPGALREEWQSFRAALHGHHQAEDTGIFPGLRSAAPVVEALEADHRRIDPLLERADAAFGGLPAAREEALAVVAQLQDLLRPHLETEEEHIIPFLRSAKEFPAPQSEAEAQMYA